MDETVCFDLIFFANVSFLITVHFCHSNLPIERIVSILISNWLLLHTARAEAAKVIGRCDKNGVIIITVEACSIERNGLLLLDR